MKPLPDTEKLVNRVEKSGIITIDLEQYFPADEPAEFDLKDYLFQGLILREKDFRQAVRSHDWSQYAGKTLLVHCSTDAIIPMWAYMLVASSAAPHARDIFYGNLEAYMHHALLERIRSLDVSPYAGKRVVLKGCGKRPIPPAAYVEMTRKLQPLVQSLMFGEPCSTVPVFKRSNPATTNA